MSSLNLKADFENIIKYVNKCQQYCYKLNFNRMCHLIYYSFTTKTCSFQRYIKHIYFTLLFSYLKKLF